MKKIEQTTLSIEDIDEHFKFLIGSDHVDLILTPDEYQVAYDDMLERLIHTFLEDLEL